MKAEWTNKDSLSIESTGQKAILVLDMPNECDECPCLNRHLWECRADKKRRSSDERPSWCPLKPMPSRKNNQESVMIGSIDMDIGYILGWNECLEELEK